MHHQTKSGSPRRGGILAAGAVAVVLALGGLGALMLTGEPTATVTTPPAAVDAAGPSTEPAPAAGFGTTRSLNPAASTVDPAVTRGPYPSADQAQSYSPYCQVPSGGICTVTPPQPVGSSCQCGGEQGRIVP
jgi:hypothetical protein